MDAAPMWRKERVGGEDYPVDDVSSTKERLEAMGLASIMLQAWLGGGLCPCLFGCDSLALQGGSR